MKTFLVGGAVRDALLRLPVKDRDWVVVGATPEAMLAQGYQQVGRDFPVFFVTHAVVKSMHWRVPNAKMAKATPVLSHNLPQT